MWTSACVTQFAPSPVAMFSAYDRKATELDAMFPTAPQYNGVYGAGMDSTEYADPFAVTGMTNANITQFAPSPVAMFPTTACYGPERNNWLDPFSDASTPDYLTGQYPGDYGWDAAGLAADPTTFTAYPEADDPDTVTELKVKEIKNNRLAMFSMFCFYVQAIATGEGPVESWVSHTANPFTVKGMTTANITQFAPSPVAMFATTACYGPERNNWLDPFSDASAPDYLNGEYPGDYGWDAAGLATDPTTFAAYREAEMIHARWAMLGTLGCLTPELLAKYTGMQVDQPVWFKVGARIFPEGGLDSLGSSNLVQTQPIPAIVACQFALMTAVEACCVNGGPLCKGMHLHHPGEASDHLDLGDDPDTVTELKVKEIKNGRLAMFSMFCCYVQAIATGEGPVESWISHIADPFAGKGMTTANITEFAPSPVAMFPTNACYGPERNNWLDPFSDASTPDYLNGEYPGDYGWDAAGLAADPTTFAAYREAEMIHARWAMLGTLGCLTPELLAKFTGMQVDQLVWFKAGARIFPEGGLDSLGSSNLVQTQPIPAIVACQFALMTAVEACSVNGGPLWKGMRLHHPGEASDHLGLGDDPNTVTELKVKEIKNGRLAMLSMFCYYVQAIATGEAAVESWVSHIADPFGVKGMTSADVTQLAPSPVADPPAVNGCQPQPLRASAPHWVPSIYGQHGGGAQTRLRLHRWRVRLVSALTLWVQGSEVPHMKERAHLLLQVMLSLTSVGAPPKQ